MRPPTTTRVKTTIFRNCRSFSWRIWRLFVNGRFSLSAFNCESFIPFNVHGKSAKAVQPACKSSRMKKRNQAFCKSPLSHHALPPPLLGRVREGGLLVPQRFNRAQISRPPGRIDAKDKTNGRCKPRRQQYRTGIHNCLKVQQIAADAGDRPT